MRTPQLNFRLASMQDQTMFRPPVNRAMKVLDRAFFQKTVPTSAARIYRHNDLSTYKKQLQSSKDEVNLPRYKSIQPDPVEETARAGGKCIVLRPEIKHNDPETWSPILRDLQQKGTLGVIPFNLHLDYNHWTYQDIIEAVLPEQDHEDKSHQHPSGFTMVGHVAHLNLRDHYLPYKHIIATVLADKNPAVRTVINKLDTVGEENPYRTFKYEVLAGPDDMNVELREQDCTFKFDFAKVYWNSRLSTEHERMVGKFKEGEAVADVMAGVGPFAVPAGKKKVFVMANDLNPESFAGLKENIALNKVHPFVKPFNEDGGKFIWKAAVAQLKLQRSVDVVSRTDKRSVHSALRRGDISAEKSVALLRTPKKLVQPRFFHHFVMNLPASAITFLPSFIGVYAQPEFMSLTEAERDAIPMPMVHVYTFGPKSDDNVAPTKEILEEVSRQLGNEITLETEEAEVWDVRDVAPKKRMFCASFRLPREVAFRKVVVKG